MASAPAAPVIGHRPYTVGVARRMLLHERTTNPGPVATELLKRRVVRAAVRRLFPQRARRRKITRRLGRGNPAPAALVAGGGIVKKLGGLFKAARFKSKGARHKERLATVNALAEAAIDGDVLAEAELERLSREFATKGARTAARQAFNAIAKAREAQELAERGARTAAGRARQEERAFETRKLAIGQVGTLAGALLRGRGLPRRRAPRRRSRRSFDF